MLTNGADSPLGLELFAVSVDNTIWHNAQTAAGDWPGWASLGNTAGPVTGIAVAQDGGGALHVCVTHKNNTVTHRRQADQGGPWTGWTNLGAPDASAIANPALIRDSEGYLNLLLTRPAKDGMITLRQQSDGRFVKGIGHPGPATPLDAAKLTRHLPKTRRALYRRTCKHPARLAHPGITTSRTGVR